MSTLSTCPYFFNTSTPAAVCFPWEFVQPTGPVNIAIYAEIFGGLGDARGSLTIGESLKESNSRYNITISAQNGFENKFKVFKQASKINLVFSTFGELLNGMYDMVIAYPIITETFRPISNLSRSLVTVLGFTEYGYQPSLHSYKLIEQNKERIDTEMHRLGPGEEELGMMMDKKLYLSYLKTSGISSQERLSENLRGIPKILQELILKDSFSLSSVEKFDTTHKLYFGYSALSEAKDIFCEVIASISTKTNPYIILVGKPITPLSEQNRGINHHFFQQLKKRGITTVEYHYGPELNSLHKKTLILNPHSPNDRVMSLICVEKLNHDLIIALEKASEPETLATGDHSIVEALSLGKIPIYEMLPHKHAFVQDLIKIASKINKAFGQYVHQILNLEFGTMDVGFDDSMEVTISKEEIQKASLALIEIKKQSKLWRRFIKQLYTHHNCLTKINAIVAEKLRKKM